MANCLWRIDLLMTLLLELEFRIEWNGIEQNGIQNKSESESDSERECECVDRKE